MATIFKRMVSGSQLTTGVAAYYTAPASTKAQIQSAVLCNSTAGAVTATVHLVPSGGSPTVSNMILSARSLAAGESYKVIEAIGQCLEAGGTIQAKASAGTSVSLVASGIEVS